MEDVKKETIEDSKAMQELKEEYKNSVAMEIVGGLKKANKRMFVIICILSACLVCNYIYNVMFPVETITQEGLYNYKDSENNFTCTDLTIDKMKELVDLYGEADD